MDYNNMMGDCVAYINRHPLDRLTAEMLGEIYSLRGEYIGYIFSCYYQEHLDTYIEAVKALAGEKKNQISFGPKKREIEPQTVKTEYKKIEAFLLEAEPVVKKRDDMYRPIETMVKNYQDRCESEDESISLWWHDEEYRSYYMQGSIFKQTQAPQGGKEVISIPDGEYMVFTMEEKGVNPAEDLKTLFYYAHTIWMEEHQMEVDEQGYSFQCLKNGKAYYYLALQQIEKQEPIDKIYGVETWIDYIDQNLAGNLTITSLAKKFHYSTTHFKRVFRMYYKMSVADYIRKRRLAVIAEEIRQGVDYMATSAAYGFKTYTGFARAFKKEFHVSPAVYSKGLFEVIDLKKYYAKYKDSLRLSIVDLEEIHMIGHTVFPSKGAEVDIPAQVSYWIGRKFPCLNNTRFECNIAVHEDKIALWYQDDAGDIEYILGPVVDSFDGDIPQEMIRVTLAGGKYAIFETEKPTDEKDVAETLRMYTRCVFFGWIKEYRDRVDLSRLTFERYENGKIYLYVPVLY